MPPVADSVDISSNMDAYRHVDCSTEQSESEYRSMSPVSLYDDYFPKIPRIWGFREELRLIHQSVLDLNRRVDVYEMTIWSALRDRKAPMELVDRMRILPMDPPPVSKINSVDVETLHDSLVVEDTERATKAANEQLAVSKETVFHRQLNGGSGQRGIPKLNAVLNKYTIPSTQYAGSSETFKGKGCCGDADDMIPPPPPINQLESFQERPYHYLNVGHIQPIVTGKGVNRANEPSEKDDEDERQHCDDLQSFSNDVKDGREMFVQLPDKTDMSGPELSMNHNSLTQVDAANQPSKKSHNDKTINNNKESEDNVETTCALDCLYFTLQCCDCSIM